MELGVDWAFESGNFVPGGHAGVRKKGDMTYETLKINSDAMAKICVKLDRFDFDSVLPLLVTDFELYDGVEALTKHCSYHEFTRGQRETKETAKADETRFHGPSY